MAFRVPRTLWLPPASGRTVTTLQLLPDFINAAEEAALLDCVTPLLARRRYERNHWDAVITGFRECQVPVAELPPMAAAAIARAFAAALPNGARAQPTVHILDLADDPSAAIGYHIDSVKFSGRIVAGISLLSDAVMRLRYEPPTSPLRSPGEAAPGGYGGGGASKPATGAVGSDGDVACLVLPQRSLYVLADDSRYEWSHAVAGGEVSLPPPVARTIRRGCRISVILRDEVA